MYTTQVKSTFRAVSLVSSEVNNCVHALAVCDARATNRFHLSAMDKKGTFTDFIRLCSVIVKREANHSTVLETSALTELFTEIQ